MYQCDGLAVCVAMQQVAGSILAVGKAVLNVNGQHSWEGACNVASQRRGVNLKVVFTNSNRKNSRPYL